MWSRKSVKRVGKMAMRGNYWKTVFVSLILATILGGASSSSAVSSGAASGAAAARSGSYAYKESQMSDTQSLSTENGDIYEGLLPEEMLAAGAGASTDSSIPPLPNEIFQNLSAQSGDSSNPADIIQNLPYAFNYSDANTAGKVVLIALGVFLLVLIVVVIIISAFLLNPLEAGIRRFFTRNLREPAEVREVLWGYDNQYLKNVKILFLRDLFLVLWSLLFIIPGIIKSYSYRMVPYILADQPDLSRKEVFALSKNLMRGNKWKAFVLDLSFIGWYLLGILTLGILLVFFVSPYKNMTDAALYDRLMYEKNKEEGVIPAAPELPETPELPEL